MPIVMNIEAILGVYTCQTPCHGIIMWKFADIHIVCPTKTLGVMKSKLFEEYFAYRDPWSEYSQIVLVSSYANFSNRIYIWVTMGKFLYKPFYLYAIWPCCWVVVVPLWFAGRLRPFLYIIVFSFSVTTIFLQLFFKF